jgi:2-C-methyl-D-erythritol 2,4-cyclodiphosphate synthase
MRIGLGYDIHVFCEDRELMLGGINVPSPKGLLGHSDADVVLHAISDAILGAAGQGDIGKHFPDTDPKYKGISSITLLDQVVSHIEEKGFKVENVDVVIICEQPKIGVYREQMEKKISESLKIEKERVNIKASTNEKVGDIGQGKAIACQAVCLLNKEV